MEAFDLGLVRLVEIRAAALDCTGIGPPVGIFVLDIRVMPETKIRKSRAVNRTRSSVADPLPISATISGFNQQAADNICGFRVKKVCYRLNNDGKAHHL